MTDADSPTIAAYYAWVNTSEEVCHCVSHWVTSVSHDYMPRPDASVCDRERKWRDYVRIRDGLGHLH